MKHFRSGLWRVCQPGALLGLLLLTANPVHSYPPAPHHTLFGLVRNQWGDPINIYPSAVFLETPTGVRFHVSMANALEPGANYRMEVPMDAGTAPDLYKPTALRPFLPFRLRVQIGNTAFLPIEMSGDFAQIGQPGQKTRIDLTLGEDSDGDGLPDAWEQALIAALGGNLTLADIRPGDDSDGDGIKNLDEYLAGTYAFDPADGFTLAIKRANQSAAELEFLAIRGRTYSVSASANLKQWFAVPFRVLPAAAEAPAIHSYVATELSLLRVEVPFQPGAERNLYFRLLVQ